MSSPCPSRFMGTRPRICSSQFVHGFFGHAELPENRAWRLGQDSPHSREFRAQRVRLPQHGRENGVPPWLAAYTLDLGRPTRSAKVVFKNDGGALVQMGQRLFDREECPPNVDVEDFVKNGLGRVADGRELRDRRRSRTGCRSCQTPLRPS